MSKKLRKTLYLPDWIVNLLEQEEKRIDKKPNEITSAAIYDFAKRKISVKKTIIKTFLIENVERGIPEEAVAEADSVVSEAEADAKARRRKKHRPHSEEAG